MTLLCLSSGLRLAELLALMPEDLDWVGEKAVVQHGKGDKRRLVPFHPIAQEAVRKYLKSDQDRVPGLPIFLSKGGRPMSDRTAEYGIGSYLEAVTGRTDISPHGLRHSAASWWVSCGVPMREIQVLLGHASIRTTERYAALVAPDIAPIRSANAVMTLAFGPPGPEAQTCAV